MKIERVWEMPDRYTFNMNCVRELLASEMAGYWADPFCGKFSPATIRNDIDETIEAESHIDGFAFLFDFPTNSIEGVLFDPPYSVEMALRRYKSKQGGTAGVTEYQANCKRQIARIVKPGGKAICFGWNSSGIGRKQGFTLERVLLICHGANHPDTIVTVETKTQDRF